jgi:hypothetical protein
MRISRDTFLGIGSVVGYSSLFLGALGQAGFLSPVTKPHLPMFIAVIISLLSVVDCVHYYIHQSTISASTTVSSLFASRGVLVRCGHDWCGGSTCARLFSTGQPKVRRHDVSSPHARWLVEFVVHHSTLRRHPSL